MPVSPETTEARAIAGRMRQFPWREGSCQYLRQLIYADSAVLGALIPDLEAATDDQDIIRGLYNATATCGSCAECSGNLKMWPLMPIAADQLDAALDVLEAPPPDPPAAPP